MAQESRPPNVDARSNRGEPMSSGAVVRIDDRNGAEALRLLHEAYYVLGRGFYDTKEGQYGSAYHAIAEFLYPDVIDLPDLGNPSDGPNCPPAILPLAE